MEVPLAWFVSSVPLEVSPQPKVVLAALGRPLFISWSPDSRTIVHVGPTASASAATHGADSDCELQRIAQRGFLLYKMQACTIKRNACQSASFMMLQAVNGERCSLLD